MSLASEAVCKTLTVSDDKLSLLLKKGSKVPSSLTKLKHSELAEALASLKIKLQPSKTTIDIIREAARVGVYSDSDFEICRGSPHKVLSLGAGNGWNHSVGQQTTPYRTKLYFGSSPLAPTAQDQTFLATRLPQRKSRRQPSSCKSSDARTRTTTTRRTWTTSFHL